MLSILAFILMLGVVIFIHELGHFVMAKRAGILCHEFALGMGPILWSKKRGETLYSLRAIPIGGFVMMAGEEVNDEMLKVGQKIKLIFEDDRVSHIVLDAEDARYQDALEVIVESYDLKGIDDQALFINEYTVKRDAYYVMKNKSLQIAPYERSFESKTLIERFLTIFMGPFMNFLLAIVLFFGIALIQGLPQENTTEIGRVPVISDEIRADTELYQMYLNSNLYNVFEVGDEVLRIEGQTVEKWSDVTRILREQVANRSIEVVVLRNGHEETLTVTPLIYIYSMGLVSSLREPESLLLNVLDNFPAHQAGMRTGDRIEAINGNPVSTWQEALSYIATNTEGEVMTLRINRNGATMSFEVDPFDEAFLSGQQIRMIAVDAGIGPIYQREFLGTFSYGFTMLFGTFSMIFSTLASLFSGTISVNMLAGPVGIASMTAQAVAAGFIAFLSWVAILSINLGIINLLPIPALDGGRLVFLGYEAIAKKPVNKRVENYIHFVMFILLIALFVYITFNDVLRLIPTE